ncbi:MAG TPA: hypothetical protein VE890_14965, partial [Thermoguttaceae bacterium]|nr:hypothetical protein [Thermoguttaceae bacterium]
MSRLPIAILCLTLSVAAWQSAPAAEPLPPAAQWIPENALLAIEVSEPGALLDLAFDPRMTERVTSVPAWKHITAEKGFIEFLGVIKILEASLGTDLETGLHKTLGGGITFAACPDDEVMLIIDAEDGEMLKQLHNILKSFAEGEAQKQGQPDRVRSAEYRGVSGWTFDGKEAHAIIGNRMIFASKSKALLKMIDMRAEQNAQCLAKVPAYQAAKKAAGRDSVASVFVNFGILKQVPGIAKALANDENPIVSLLFAGVTEALENSSWLSLDLTIDDDVLSLQAAVDGKTGDQDGAAAFAFPSDPNEGALPNLEVPRRIAAMSFWRDLHAFYGAKDDLFPERTGGLIFFENMMGIFFSGRDLTEDVLAETYPEVRLVVAEQDYGDRAPDLQIPSFGAIFRLRDAEKFALVAEEAWQKAIGLVNFTRGQQAQAGMIIRQPTHDETTYTMAYFLSGGEDAELEQRHNFRPSLVNVGDFLVLSSTDALAEDLIDALKQEIDQPPKPLAQTHSVVDFDVVQLASILKANRENLIRKSIIDKGQSEEQAAAETDILLTIIANLGQLKLNVGSRNSLSHATLQ